MRMLRRLWQDDAGFIVSAELILIATIAVIGLIAGLATVRNSITNELADVGGAIDNLNQSYGIARVQAHSGDSNATTDFDDRRDFCNEVATNNVAMGCILFNNSAAVTANAIVGNGTSEIP